VKAGLNGNMDDALLALAADPVCAHLTVSDIKKMGRELLQANKQCALPSLDCATTASESPHLRVYN